MNDEKNLSKTKEMKLFLNHPFSAALQKGGVLCLGAKSEPWGSLSGSFRPGLQGSSNGFHPADTEADSLLGGGG